MFRLFRKFRREVFSGKKTRGYLKYAFGELVLVVLGILIALEINNRNEERIEQREIAEYAHSLIKDLERDLEMVAEVILQMEYLKNKTDDLSDYVRGKSIDQIKNFDLFFYMRKPYYLPYQWNRTSLEQMKNSGALRKMKNRSLAEKISVYDAYTRHLDEDFEHDRRMGDRSGALANRVIDRNYPNIWELVGSDIREYPSFPSQSLHETYKNADRPLLTDDIKEIKIAVNSFLDLADTPGLGPRVDTEMPLLLVRARELIKLLKAEYPE